MIFLAFTFASLTIAILFHMLEQFFFSRETIDVATYGIQGLIATFSNIIATLCFLKYEKTYARAIKAIPKKFQPTTEHHRATTDTEDTILSATQEFNQRLSKILSKPTDDFKPFPLEVDKRRK